MSEGAPGVSSDERRALWLEVLRWPLGGGMLLHLIALAGLAVWSVSLEGGASASVRETRAFFQAGVMFAAVIVFAVAARRAISCTYPAERPVPWLRDEADDASLGSVIGGFAGVLAIAMAPLVVWIAFLRGPLGAPTWVDWIVTAVCTVYAGATLPLGLGAAAVTGSPLAALPKTLSKMRRAEPYAARIASYTGIAFIGALVLSAFLAEVMVKHPLGTTDFLASPKPPVETVSTFTFVVLTVLRVAGFHLGLVACRVAGLLVREVPEIREVLA